MSRIDIKQSGQSLRHMSWEDQLKLFVSIKYHEKFCDSLKRSLLI